MVLCFSFTIWVNTAQASIKINNEFKATSSCEAVKSIRKGTNPGNITIVPETIYQAKEKNKPEATHYRIEINDAKPALRWVAVDCGELLISGLVANPIAEDSGTSGSENPVIKVSVTRNPGIANPDYLLAISWQPAFCETRPNKTECRTQNENRFDAEQFTLHGLWPQPQNNVYCGVSQRNKQLDKDGDWFDLPAIALSDDLFDELAIKMPGVASGLHLHEWYKHGTCYSPTPEEYYRESLILLDQVNNSVVQDLFATNIGEEISSNQITNKFEESFGDVADSKISIKCKLDERPRRRRMFTELWLNFKGIIEPDTQVSDLFEGGKRVSIRCPSAEVDEVGLN